MEKRSLEERFTELTNEEIVELFNPDKAGEIPEEVLRLMAGLNTGQIRDLAAAYPNKPVGNTYLILKDLNADRQLFPRSTWANLLSLRNAGVNNFVPFTFTSRFNVVEVQERPRQKFPQAEDLTDEEKFGAEGLRLAPVQEVSEGEKAVVVDLQAQQGRESGSVDQSIQEGGDGQETGENQDENSEGFEETVIEDIENEQDEFEDLSEEEVIEDVENEENEFEGLSEEEETVIEDVEKEEDEFEDLSEEAEKKHIEVEGRKKRGRGKNKN